MNNRRHDFDQEPQLCPKHGLTVNSEDLCIVCRLALEGIEPEAHGRYDKKTTGIPPGESLASMNRRDYRSRQRKKIEEAEEKAKKSKKTEKK